MFFLQAKAHSEFSPSSELGTQIGTTWWQVGKLELGSCGSIFQLSSALDFGGPESHFSHLVCLLSAQVQILPGDMLAQT